MRKSKGTAIRSPVEGIIESITVVRGDTVRRGQILATLDLPPLLRRARECEHVADLRIDSRHLDAHRDVTLPDI